MIPTSEPSDKLKLPLEIREEIYRYLLVPPGPSDQYLECIAFFHLHTMHMERDTSILLVSRQISEEALDILYGENVFKLDVNEDQDCFVTRFTVRNRLRIRHLLLVSRPYRYDRGLLSGLEFVIWSPILANLTKLCIVAQEPLPGCFFNPLWDDVPDGSQTTLKKLLDDWAISLKAIFVFINQHLSKDMVVLVDDGSREYTTKLIRQCLSNNTKSVKIRLGDIYFKRDEFALIWLDSVN